MIRSESAEPLDRRIATDPIVVGILLFFVCHTAIRLFGTSNFSVDETMTAIHTQRFHIIYLLRNPPMFDWLYYGLSRVLGGSLLTMQILKTGLLAGGAVFLFLAVKPCFRHRVALAGLMASYGATAFYGWEILQLYSHTNALIFALGFTFWAFMRVVRRQGSADYALLGLALGFGMLSKYLFGLFFLALVVAALRLPRYRASLSSWRVVITLCIGVLVTAPFLYRLLGSFDDVLFAIGGRVGGSKDGGVWSALVGLLVQSAQFWLPFTVMLWACLTRWPAPAESSADTGCDEPARADFFVLLRDTTLLATAATLVAVLFLQTRITAGHYLVPVLSLLPAVLFAAIDRRQPFPEAALHMYLRGTVALMVGVAVVRLLLFLLVSPPFCVPRCILFVDYGQVIERLDRSDGRQNVILSNDIHIGSNLLRALPNARVIVPTDAGGLGVGVADADDRNCDFVWFRTYQGQHEQSLETALRSILPEVSGNMLAAVGPPEYVTADWQTKLLWDRGPDTVIGIATIDSASPLCEGAGLPPPPAWSASRK